MLARSPIDEAPAQARAIVAGVLGFSRCAEALTILDALRQDEDGHVARAAEQAAVEVRTALGR